MSMDVKVVKKAATKAALAERKPRVDWFQVHLDDEVAGRVEELRVKKARSENGHGVWITDDQDALEEAERELEESTSALKLVAIGGVAYDDLVEAHPVPEEELEELKAANGGDAPAWNPDTFPKALVRATVAEPELSEAEFDSLVWHNPGWNAGELQQLFMQCLRVNTARRMVRLGN